MVTKTGFPLKGAAKWRTIFTYFSPGLFLDKVMSNRGPTGLTRTYWPAVVVDLMRFIKVW